MRARTVTLGHGIPQAFPIGLDPAPFEGSARGNPFVPGFAASIQPCPSVHFGAAGHPRFRVRHTRLGGFGEPGLRRAWESG